MPSKSYCGYAKRKEADPTSDVLLTRPWSALRPRFCPIPSSVSKPDIESADPKLLDEISPTELA